MSGVDGRCLCRCIMHRGMRRPTPGSSPRACFGEAMVVIGGIEQKAHFFAFDLPHSDACYIRAYPAATSEAWVDGHVHAFAFFGRVPVSVLYDNDKCPPFGHASMP